MKKIKYAAAALLIGIGSMGFVINEKTATAKKLVEVETVVGTNIGDKAPDIIMNDLKGKERKLSDLKGSLVLIDFWASWCGPCRRENPNVVRAYKKYQKAKFKSAKSFDIFSVSLDKDQKRWEAAVEQDQLSWNNHVSDLKGWENGAAKKYGVHSIPMSFLIDENGIIVGKELRGIQLHAAIDKHVAKL